MIKAVENVTKECVFSSFFRFFVGGFLLLMVVTGRIDGVNPMFLCCQMSRTKLA